jgi:hypothetical protein
MQERGQMAYQIFLKAAKYCHPQHSDTFCGNNWQTKAGSFEPQKDIHQRPHEVTRAYSAMTSLLVNLDRKGLQYGNF